MQSESGDERTHAFIAMPRHVRPSRSLRKEGGVAWVIWPGSRLSRSLGGVYGLQAVHADQAQFPRGGSDLRSVPPPEFGRIDFYAKVPTAATRPTKSNTWDMVHGAPTGEANIIRNRIQNSDTHKL